MKKLLALVLSFLMVGGIFVKDNHAQGIKHINEDTYTPSALKEKRKKTKLLYHNEAIILAKTKNYQKRDTYQVNFYVRQFKTRYKIDLRKVKHLNVKLYGDQKLMKKGSFNMQSKYRRITVSDQALKKYDAVGYGFDLFSMPYKNVDHVKNYRFVFTFDGKKKTLKFACRY